MRRRLFMLLLMVGCGTLGAAEPRQLVLVAAAESPMETLSALEVRMLYLGYSVQRGPVSLRAVRNMSSPLVNDVFLQHVVAMTETSYQRRVLVAMLQKGRQPPPELRSVAEVVRRLERDRAAVSYLWLDEVQQYPRLKVLRVLWVE